uniref:BppL_N domain-containing protein n=1 Tax=Rhabditophanes sp. KR3021 TaxID=114890 RepID=A0AC35TTD3_9BILA
MSKFALYFYAFALIATAIATDTPDGVYNVTEQIPLEKLEQTLVVTNGLATKIAFLSNNMTSLIYQMSANGNLNQNIMKLQNDSQVLTDNQASLASLIASVTDTYNIVQGRLNNYTAIATCMRNSNCVETPSTTLPPPTTTLSSVTDGACSKFDTGKTITSSGSFQSISCKYTITTSTSVTLTYIIVQGSSTLTIGTKKFSATSYTPQIVDSLKAPFDITVTSPTNCGGNKNMKIVSTDKTKPKGLSGTSSKSKPWTLGSTKKDKKDKVDIKGRGNDIKVPEQKGIAGTNDANYQTLANLAGDCFGADKGAGKAVGGPKVPAVGGVAGTNDPNYQTLGGLAADCFGGDKKAAGSAPEGPKAPAAGGIAGTNDPNYQTLGGLAADCFGADKKGDVARGPKAPVDKNAKAGTYDRNYQTLNDLGVDVFGADKKGGAARPKAPTDRNAKAVTNDPNYQTLAGLGGDCFKK